VSEERLKRMGKKKGNKEPVKKRAAADVRLGVKTVPTNRGRTRASVSEKIVKKKEMQQTSFK